MSDASAQSPAELECQRQQLHERAVTAARNAFTDRHGSKVCLFCGGAFSPRNFLSHLKHAHRPELITGGQVK